MTTNATVDKFSRLVPIDEIRANDYNLNIPRYVDSSAAAESWDVYATMFGGVPKAEVDALERYWKVWPSPQRATLPQRRRFVSCARDRRRCASSEGKCRRPRLLGRLS